ncbi:MAG: methyltransferase domain-containing protein [Lachnospiraceae bacterium]|nr:methyltransferase domain-containing protein [Lachnospiraceae bacterium]
MKKMNLRIADLRREKKITQKELADAMGVSFQTISKWEKGVNLPDITFLPAMAEYFKVSIDQLMGMVPLNNEEYIKEKTGTGQFWEQKLEYLLRTRRNSWNEDYVQFLVDKVWKIDKPMKVLDLGCGFGFLGLLFMPFLPKGSTYTGIDLAENLLKEGEKLFADKDYEVRFIHKDVYEYHAKEQYDLVICQGVLRHLDTPEAFLQKMIEFAKKDAHVVCIDANREFECDGLYVDGMDYFWLCKHDGMEAHWRTELEQQGRDYAVAIRTAHMMRKLGLREVSVRMKDQVDFVTPQRDDYEQLKQDFLEFNDWNAGLSPQEQENSIRFLMNHGMSRKEATDYCNRNVKISEYFQLHPDAGYTFVKGTMISYGKK